VGYAGAWKQAQTAVAQAREETQRLNVGFAEEHLRNRQETYHQFLKTLRELDAYLVGQAPLDPTVLAEWRDRYNLYRAGIDLFGAPTVIAATNAVGGALGKAMPRVTLESEVAQKRMRETFYTHRAELHEARAALTAAMRADVAVPYTGE